MSKIKVLHYLPNLGLGGTEKTCQLFFEHSSSEFESSVAYPINCDLTRHGEFVKAARACNGKLFPFDGMHGLQDIITNNTIDILHVYRSGYKESPEPGVDVCVPHFVETNIFGFIDTNPKISRSLFMSEWLMNYSLSRFTPYMLPRQRFDFVNNPVDDPSSQLRMNLDVPEGTIVLGRCGRPDNGIYNSVSVKAAHMLLIQGYKIHFLVVAPPTNMLDDLAKYGIPFHAISPTTNEEVLSSFYNTIDIYAHARADGESFGVNIAEAMMHAKPVVTHWATPSFPGMGVFQAQTTLVDNGKTGFVVENDVAEYAEALKKLIDDKTLRVNMGVAGTLKAHEEYHVKTCVSKLENIYKDIYAAH
jgi:glycosyltransferase involved in cell wall biosynthesis